MLFEIGDCKFNPASDFFLDEPAQVTMVLGDGARDRNVGNSVQRYGDCAGCVERGGDGLYGDCSFYEQRYASGAAAEFDTDEWSGNVFSDAENGGGSDDHSNRYGDGNDYRSFGGDYGGRGNADYPAGEDSGNGVWHRDRQSGTN